MPNRGVPVTSPFMQALLGTYLQLVAETSPSMCAVFVVCQGTSS